MLASLLFCSRSKSVRYSSQPLKTPAFHLNINFFPPDPSVKSLVLQSLLNEEKSDLPSSFSRSDDQHSASSDTSSFTSASSSRSESPITCENTSNTHVWKAEEEDVLVNLRHEKNEKFLKSKNHSTLWKDITAQLKDTLHCIVTPNQAMNKYYSLKKNAGKKLLMPQLELKGNIFDRKSSLMKYMVQEKVQNPPSR